MLLNFDSFLEVILTKLFVSLFLSGVIRYENIRKLLNILDEQTHVSVRESVRKLASALYGQRLKVC